jgi:hypothetical protein
MAAKEEERHKGLLTPKKHFLSHWSGGNGIDRRARAFFRKWEIWISFPILFFRNQLNSFPPERLRSFSEQENWKMRFPQKPSKFVSTIEI